MRPPSLPAGAPGPSRGAPRAELEVEVTYESGHTFYTGFTENISSGGLFIQTMAPRPVGSQLRVKLTLPGSTSMEADGVVRWIREVGDPEHHGMGVQFLALSAPARTAIDQFIAARGSLFYDHE
jgi:uncharacterized protein (TIGR02266 family)